MGYLEISRIITLVASALITYGLYDQAIRIYKIKSARDFSMSIIFALMINELAWLNYGISLSEWPIILVGAVNIPPLIMIFTGYFKYKNR